MLPGKDGFELLNELKKAEIIQIKDVIIDEEKRIVTRNSKEISLQPMEYDVIITVPRIGYRMEV